MTTEPQRSLPAGLYAFLPEQHPLAPFFAARRSELARVLAAEGAGARVTGADLKAAPLPEGGWQPARLAVEIDDAAGRALWLWSSKRGESVLHRFPHDPYLPGLAPWAAAPVDAQGRALEGVRLLRYVPTRRATLAAEVAGGGEQLVVKFKRASKRAHSADMLSRVHRAAEASGSGIVTARPLGEIAGSDAFCQEHLAGRPLDGDITAATLEAAMRTAGGMHARLHALDVPGVAAWSLAQYADTIDEDVAWIGFMWPEAGAAVAGAWARIAPRVRRGEGARSVFCHGDFVPGQLLAAPDRIAVTDFDMAREGIDLQEIGKWIAALKYHVPLVARALAAAPAIAAKWLAAAEDAYLAGYETAAGRAIGRAALAPFVAAAEVHYLGIWLKKDRFAPAAFAVALDRITRIA